MRVLVDTRERGTEMTTEVDSQHGQSGADYIAPQGPGSPPIATEPCEMLVERV